MTAGKAISWRASFAQSRTYLRNVFQTNFTDGDVDGETLVGRRTSIGDGADDVITGDSFIDIMDGGGGLDTLFGAGGNDSLVGGPGEDSLNGGLGDDTLRGGLGDDTYTFGVATAGGELDTLIELLNEGTDTLNFASQTTSVTVDLRLTTSQVVHTNRTIVLNSDVAFENLRGGSGSDLLRGNNAANSLFGNGGSDTLNGFAGSDVLVGGPGDDTYSFSPTSVAEVDTLTEIAGQGTDTLNFGSLTTAVTLNLGIITTQAVHTNRSIALSSASTFENASGGSAGDVLRGNAGNNSLFGNGGSDTLIGLNGNDTLSGGFGRDFLIGGRGLDVLNGNQGEDLLIAGYTLFIGVEDSAGFLQSVSEEWSGPGTFEERVEALTPVLVPGSTVRNDAQTDTLTSNGDLSLDWLFASAADGVVKDVGDLLTLL